MNAPALIIPPVPVSRIRTPRIDIHVTSITVGAASVGIVTAVDGAIVAAFIAGAFTLVNTVLTIVLTRPQRRTRRRRNEREQDDQ
jgi:flavin reductase (DIM6/NTAB) family NADH-FMN oxidoreductase RutF